MTPPPVPPARTRDTEGGPRLSGALMVIFWCACGITAVPLAGAFALAAALGPQGAVSATFDALSGNAVGSQVLRLGLIPQAVLFVWGASFVVLTVMRARLALKVAPALLALWVLVTAFCQFAIRSALAPEGSTVMDFAALLPGLLVQATAAAALYGYFVEGARPRAFYRR